MGELQFKLISNFVSFVVPEWLWEFLFFVTIILSFGYENNLYGLALRVPTSYYY